MNVFEIIGLIAGVLAAASYVPYVFDIVRKKVKPERASWLIWSLLVGIALFAQLFKGAEDSLWFTLFDSAGAFVIFLLSIKYGVGGLTKRDIRGLIGAGIGLLLWYLTKDPIWALVITIIVDAIAVALNVAKTLEDPKSETYLMWSTVSFAAILGMISVGELNYGLLVYPFYIFLANFSVVVAKFVGTKLAKKK
jgi:F0F1-type ATP synthase assembly protein I